MEKEFMLQIGGYFLTFIVYLFLSWRYKGKEEVSKEILNQELAYKEKGLGDLKKKAVQEFVSKLPAHVRIFINETTIEAVVKEMQPLFRKMKEGK